MAQDVPTRLETRGVAQRRTAAVHKFKQFTIEGYT